MFGTLVAVLFAVVHEQNVERATDSALHGRVELPFKTAVETTERVPGIGMFLANNIVGQFVVFNEHDVIVDFGGVKAVLQIGAAAVLLQADRVIVILIAVVEGLHGWIVGYRMG